MTHVTQQQAVEDAKERTPDAAAEAEMMDLERSAQILLKKPSRRTFSMCAM